MKTKRIITTLLVMVIVALAFGAKKPTTTIKERITLEQCVFEYYDTHSDTYLVTISRFFVTYQLGTHLSILTFFNKNNCQFIWCIRKKSLSLHRD